MGSAPSAPLSTLGRQRAVRQEAAEAHRRRPPPGLHYRRAASLRRLGASGHGLSASRGSSDVAERPSAVTRARGGAARRPDRISPQPAASVHCGTSLGISPGQISTPRRAADRPSPPLARSRGSTCHENGRRPAPARARERARAISRAGSASEQPRRGRRVNLGRRSAASAVAVRNQCRTATASPRPWPLAHSVAAISRHR